MKRWWFGCFCIAVLLLISTLVYKYLSGRQEGLRLTWPQHGSIGNRTRLAFRSDGSLLVLTELAEIHRWRRLKSWTVQPIVSLIPPSLNHGDTVDGIWGWAWNDDALTPDGRFALGFADTQAGCGVWDTSTGNLLGRLGEATGRFPTYALNPKGTWLAAILKSNLPHRSDSIGIFALPSGKIVSRLLLGGQPMALAISPDGRMIAAIAVFPVMSKDGHSRKRTSVLLIKDRQTGRTIYRQEERWAYPNRLLFSPNGMEIAVSGDEDTIHLISYRTGQTRLVLSAGHSWGLMPRSLPISPIAFSPDTRRLACIRGFRIIVFDTVTGRIISRLRPAHDPRLVGDQEPETAVFSADSQWLAASVKLGQGITVWPTKDLGLFDTTADDQRVQKPAPGVVY